MELNASDDRGISVFRDKNFAAGAIGQADPSRALLEVTDRIPDVLIDDLVESFTKSEFKHVACVAHKVICVI